MTLEEYFTHLEFLIRLVDVTATDPTATRARFVRMRDNLMAGLSAVLEAATRDGLKKNGCDLHELLVEKLERRDVIISFNYDCLIDYALKQHGGLKWNPRWGYGAPVRDTEALGYWSPTAQAKKPETIRLLKLHGSVNWAELQKGADEIVLKRRVHQQNGTPRFSIIPPVWNKSIESDIYLDLWEQAAEAVRHAVTITIVGFSFAGTDLYAQTLFRAALERYSRLRNLIIVTPDGNARRRIRSVFEVPLAKGVVVRQYDYFADFTSDEESWS